MDSAKGKDTLGTCAYKPRFSSQGVLKWQQKQVLT
jgi:hypothetical protein